MTECEWSLEEEGNVILKLIYKNIPAYVSMEVLDKICTRFGVQPNDIIEHIRE